MNSTGAFRPFLRASLTISSVEVTVTPFFKACVFAFWMVGPSAIGSVNGRPNSMRSYEKSAHGIKVPYRRPTSSTCFHSKQYVDRLRCSGESSGDIGDQGWAFLFLALRKCLLDGFHDLC